MKRRPIRWLRGRPRRGTALYVMVMGVSLIVAAIGLSAITISRTQLRMNVGEQEASQARLLAASAVENALVVINANSNWRTDYQDSIEYPATPVTFGDGTFTWKLVDKDGSLDDDSADAVRVYGIGRLGQHVCTESVQLEPSGNPLTCLEVSAHADNSVTFSSATVTGNQIISTNNSIAASSSNIGPAVQAANSISGGSFNGGTTEGITPRTMPDPDSVFDYYIANATTIDISSIPTAANKHTIRFTVLSPNFNPYGTGETNPEGIYLIDCQGSELRVYLCRIVGTLVVLNASNFEVLNEVNWEPAVSNFPSLLVQGTASIFFDSTRPLTEQDAAGVSLNPSHTPYQGQWDDDALDSYPSVMRGLVYISSHLTTFTAPSLDGVLVVGNTLSVSDGELDLKYASTFLNNPPPGFRSGDVLEVVRSSWKRGPAN